MAIASRGGGGRHDNRNPKSSDFIAKLKSKLSARDFARFERAESCHRNHFENMPLFVASVLASLFVERQTGVRLNTRLNAALVLGTRVLYTLNYGRLLGDLSMLMLMTVFSDDRNPEMELCPQHLVLHQRRIVLQDDSPCSKGVGG